MCEGYSQMPAYVEIGKTGQPNLGDLLKKNHFFLNPSKHFKFK